MGQEISTVSTIEWARTSSRAPLLLNSQNRQPRGVGVDRQGSADGKVVAKVGTVDEDLAIRHARDDLEGIREGLDAAQESVASLAGREGLSHQIFQVTAIKGQDNTTGGADRGGCAGGGSDPDPAGFLALRGVGSNAEKIGGYGGGVGVGHENIVEHGRADVITIDGDPEAVELDSLESTAAEFFEDSGKVESRPRREIANAGVRIGVDREDWRCRDAVREVENRPVAADSHDEVVGITARHVASVAEVKIDLLIVEVGDQLIQASLVCLVRTLQLLNADMSLGEEGGDLWIALIEDVALVATFFVGHQDTAFIKHGSTGRRVESQEPCHEAIGL